MNESCNFFETIVELDQGENFAGRTAPCAKLSKHGKFTGQSLHTIQCDTVSHRERPVFMHPSHEIDSW